MPVREKWPREKDRVFHVLMFSLLTVMDAGDKDTDKEVSGRDRYKLKNHTNMNVYKQ